MPFQSFGRTNFSTSIQCVSGKILYLKGSWWPESLFMRKFTFSWFHPPPHLLAKNVVWPKSINCIFLGLIFSNNFLSFLKSGQWEVGGRGPDLKLVRWRQSPLLRPAQTQTSHMCPSDPPSMAWRSPLRAYVTQAVPISPILTPPPTPTIQPLERPLAETCFGFILREISL